MNKIQNMLLGIAIGDAFGAGYEFMGGGRTGVRNAFDFTKYGKHHFPGTRHVPGLYTDDTQMSIAVTETLLYERFFEKETLAKRFVSCFKRDPIDGYSSALQGILESVDSGEELLRKIKPRSTRNGAAMRAVPIGMVKDLETVIDYAAINATVTHDTPEGLGSSVAVALMSYHAYHDIHEPLIDFVQSGIRRFDPDTAWHLREVDRDNSIERILGEENLETGVPSEGRRTVGAVYYVLSNFGDSPKDVLKESVLLGGDTDSVASIALGISAIKHGLKDLPEFLYKDLTEHIYGKAFLKMLGDTI